MENKTLLIIVFILLGYKSFGQNQSENVVYIIDKITILEDPERGNEVNKNDIADVNVIKNKDTLKSLGFEKFDGAIYIYTKEYRNREEEIKKIPSTKEMERKDGLWYYNNEICEGKFIDYYYSGKKQGDGILKNGKVDGLRKMYYQNGNLLRELYYNNSVPNGLDKGYYEDGSLKQKGEFLNGKESGIWESYFPNGQVKLQSNYKNGEVCDTVIKYYSNGKIREKVFIKDGKVTPDFSLKKIDELLEKSRESNKKGDAKSVIKYCNKIIELDSEFAEAYFSRGTIKLNEMQFDEAIADFDKALTIEPFMEFALANRAFARIRKYQFSGDRELLKNSEVTVLASKKKTEISEIEKNNICNDLQKSIFLGNKVEMVLDAEDEYCINKK
jgi:antitoxin component YwqK of YwqJK toxin-antitoxin module